MGQVLEARALGCALIALLVQGCVFYPKAQRPVEETCKPISKQWALDYVTIKGFNGGCGGKDCAYLLVAIGAVAAASAVVSGSVVVVGNTVYWLETQGNCPFTRENRAL